jgi:hypothetical protein
MTAERRNLLRFMCISGLLLFVCGCTSVPERNAFRAIHRKPYDAATNNCQHKARAYAEVLSRAGYDAKLVHVMTLTSAHMLVQVQDGRRTLWLDPTAGRKLSDLEGWSYYRIGDGPVLPVVVELSASEQRALDYYKAIDNGEFDAELVAVHVGHDGNWRKIPEAQWADYTRPRTGAVIAACSR